MIPARILIPVTNWATTNKGGQEEASTRVRVVIKDNCFSRNPDELDHVCRENAHSSQHAISNRKVLNAEKRAAETSPAITSHIYKKVARKCEEHRKAKSPERCYLLQHPPQIREYAAIASFVLYFQGQWNTEASRQLLNQYENDGPRTTNFSEGWNNTLRNQFGSLHPGLGEFLQSMQKELYRQSVESERLLRGQPIRLRRRKYREAEAKLAEVRQEYRAVLEANILLEEHIEQDEIQTVLIPFARKMAFCCATFIDAETLLERSAVEEELQPGQELEASNEENSQNSDLSAFFANEE
ncbi:hypothetical protein DdX_06279 [Ditylenchus destructor]|uniref:Uncharacterized protein n=1 Tax=Ditylenchus destructor TaxID=166010 RepID=A0AAD4N8Z3_9BILA|nr:hypothetical protein DdX_06279 [Ditylenchus destructor]